MKSVKEIIIIVVAAVLVVLALVGLAKVFDIDLTVQQSEPTPVESSMDTPTPKIR